MVISVSSNQQTNCSHPHLSTGGDDRPFAAEVAYIYRGQALLVPHIRRIPAYELVETFCTGYFLQILIMFPIGRTFAKFLPGACRPKRGVKAALYRCASGVATGGRGKEEFWQRIRRH